MKILIHVPSDLTGNEGIREIELVSFKPSVLSFIYQAALSIMGLFQNISITLFRKEVLRENLVQKFTKDKITCHQSLTDGIPNFGSHRVRALHVQQHVECSTPHTIMPHSSLTKSVQEKQGKTLPEACINDLTK